MKPLRAFLFTQGTDGNWSSSAFRELEPLIDAVRSALSVSSASAVVHVGFWRPETQKVAELAQAWSGVLLLSEAALNAFPPPVKASSQIAGEIDGLKFMLALEGFGYEMIDPAHISMSDDQSISKNLKKQQNTFEPKGWVEKVIAANPETLSALRDANIWDDESYLENETSLNTELRLSLAIYRYAQFTGEKPNDIGILNNLHACPHWFLRCEVRSLPITVRMNNVFKSHNIKFIGDIALKGYNGLLRLPNLGLGSVHAIGRLLCDALINANALKRSELNSNSLLEVFKSVDRSILTIDEEIGLATETVSAEDAKKTSFLDGFIDAIQLPTDPERGVLFARLGFRCEQQKIQQISDHLGLPGYQVRQIESKIYKKIKRHNFWLTLAERLEKFLTNRTTPLLLNGLSASDSWFVGAEEMATPLIEIFKHVLADEFSILQIENISVVTRLQFSAWNQAIESGKLLIKELVLEQSSEELVRFQVEALLSGRGEELRETLWHQVSEYALWSHALNQPRKLLGYGKTAEAIVIAVLRDVDMPLHYEEIHKRSLFLCPHKYDVRFMHSVANKVAELYARGTYGLLTHCPLNHDEVTLIVAEIENLVAGGDSIRQWHTSELLDQLQDRGLDFDGRISKYVINIALRNSPLLIYMGRMIWGLRESWINSVASRLDTRQAVISLLESAGKPLTTTEIRTQLLSGRGVNSDFQIHASENLIRIGAGKWGLADRDLLIQNPELQMARIAQQLELTQEGIHISEVTELLGGIDENIAMALVGYCKSKGMRIDRAQYLYEGSWANSGRIWPSDAARIALEMSPIGGLTFDEVCNEVERLTKRKFQRVQISQFLATMDGSVFDSLTERWRIQKNLLVDIEDDESEQLT